MRMQLDQTHQPLSTETAMWRKGYAARTSVSDSYLARYFTGEVSEAAGLEIGSEERDSYPTLLTGTMSRIFLGTKVQGLALPKEV